MGGESPIERPRHIVYNFPMLPLQALSTRKIFTITEITRDMRFLLEDNFASVWVSGEVSNCKKAASGHVYLTLKDEASQLPVVMFRKEASRLRFDLEDGLKIIIHGHVTVYEPRGQYQLVADYAEPKGLGALQLAYEQLKKRLAEEGLFDAAIKKTLPPYPQKIGIITSPKGAVVHDMITIMKRRYSNMDVLIYPVKVQGTGASLEIAQAIHALNDEPDLDLLIVGRGGGSLEDLWAFNEEVVIRAIRQSRLPVISAVGHETDTTLADLAADMRAPTPSAAAEMAVPEKTILADQVAQYRSQLRYTMAQTMNYLREQITLAKKRVKHPAWYLEHCSLRLDELTGRMIRAAKASMAGQRHALHKLVWGLPDFASRLRELKTLVLGLQKSLKALSPMAPLNRGYSLIMKADGTLVRSKGQVEPGDLVTARVADGELKAKVM